MDEKLVHLVIRAKAGDRQAFGELYEQFKGLVARIVFSVVRNWHEADELCHDVFLNAQRKIGQLQRPKAFQAWVCAIAHNTAKNAYARKKYLGSFPAASLSDKHADPCCAAMKAERQSLVHSTLPHLSAMDQQALHAFYFQGLSLKDMSALFSVPEGTVKRRLFDARMRLGKELRTRYPADFAA